MPTKLIGTEITETGQNLTTEHKLFTYTASGEQDVSVQVAFASLTNTAAALTVRVEHEFMRGEASILSNMAVSVITKFSATATTEGMRRLGPFHLLKCEKINVHATSTNASDTSVTYWAKVLDEFSALSADTRLAYLDAAVSTRSVFAAGGNVIATNFTAAPTAEDNGAAAAIAILETPANKLATDEDGAVTAGNAPEVDLTAVLASLSKIQAGVYDSDTYDADADAYELSNGATVAHDPTTGARTTTEATTP